MKEFLENESLDPIEDSQEKSNNIISGQPLMEYIKPQNGKNLLKDLGENPYASPLRREVAFVCYNLARVFDGGQCYSVEKVKKYIDSALVGGDYQMGLVHLDDEKRDEIRKILYEKLGIE